MGIFSRRTPSEEQGEDGGSIESSDSEHPTAHWWRRPKTVLFTILLIGLCAGFLSWLGYEAQAAKANLEQARDAARQVKTALSKGQVDEAMRLADSAAAFAHDANAETHSVPWTIAANIPWLGSPFRSAQQISGVVLGVATDVLQPSAQVAVVLAPSQLLKDGRLDVQSLREKAPALTSISAAAQRLNIESASITNPTYIRSVGTARTDLQEQTASLAKFLDGVSIAAKLVPSMMGGDGPRTYLMGFQTNAEARGTGGILGGFGILRFDNGQPAVEVLGSNTELTHPFTPIDLGREFNDLYGYTNPTTDFRNSNLSSHFPYAAQIWRSMWAQQSGTTVDGVLALDPVALSYILAAVGPVTLPDGEIISKDNVVEITESTAYLRYPTDQLARKHYLQTIAGGVVKKMTGPLNSPRDLLEGLGKAVREGRIALWSATDTEQKILEQTMLAHEIPDDAAPYAELVVNNLAGNKIDYYLRREIEYSADACNGPTRNTTVTIRLKSVVPNVPLPEYVAGALGLNPQVPIRLPSGSMLTSVRLVATKGAMLESAFSNGQRVSVFTNAERGHPTFEIQVAIPPRQSGELTFHLSEPNVPGTPRVPVQALVDNVTPVVKVPTCTG